MWRDRIIFVCNRGFQDFRMEKIANCEINNERRWRYESKNRILDSTITSKSILS
jgi:hypothetical protein